MNTTVNFTPYYAAISADSIFQTELIRVYGAKACIVRYQIRPYSDAALELAKRQMLQACQAWWLLGRVAA